MGLAAWWSPHAFAWQANLGVGAAWEYSDNVTLAAEGAEESGSVAVAVANLQVTEHTADAQADLVAILQYRDYQSGPFSDEFLLSLVGSGEWALDDRGTKWFVEDRYDQAEVDVLAPPTPENRQDANVFSTGPELQWRLSPTQSIVSGARYSNFYYEESRADSNRLSGYARWLYAMNPRRDLSANIEASAVDFTDDAFGDYRRADTFLRLENRWSRAGVEADLGGTVIRRDRADDVDGFLGRLRWRLDLNSVSDLEGAIISQYTDVGHEFLSAEAEAGTGGLIAEPVTGDVYYTHQASVAYTWQGIRTSLHASGLVGNDDYRTTDNDRDFQEAAVGVGYDLSATLHLTMDLHYERSEYQEVDTTVTDTTGGVRLAYQINPRLSAAISAAHTESDASDSVASYEENRVLVSINYGYPRRPAMPLPAEQEPVRD